ncbi:hypothetical protein AHAS_Ahas16G0236000 [Arachis hypogaea]
MVQKFYDNLWITYKDIIGVNEKNHRSFVRGRIIDFSPQNIRQILRLSLTDYTVEECYNERVNRDRQLDQVLANICIPGAQWRLGSKRRSFQLKSSDLLSLARGWLDFIWRSIMPTSNQSECTVDHAIMIHCIMKGEIVEVEDIIAQQIYSIASNSAKNARLGFPHLIYR